MIEKREKCVRLRQSVALDVPKQIRYPDMHTNRFKYEDMMTYKEEDVCI